MRLASIVCGVLVLGVAMCVLIGWAWRTQTRDQETHGDVVRYERVLALASPSPHTVASSLREIDRKWHAGAAMMLLEVVQFVHTHQAFVEALRLLQRKTGQTFGDDLGSWYAWIWSREYDPHPQYAQFKSNLHSKLDPRFREYFVKTDNAQIRLDEIRWGGVKRDGIPPLNKPKMIPAKQAAYLEDSNVVFGVTLNGDARCYPKRILAWHEMFKDTIGGIPVCGAY